MIIRKNDQVVVIAGVHRSYEKGKDTTRHRVLRTMPAEEKIVVEGINEVWKHVRRSQKNPSGGRIKKEAPIHVSNVMLWCDNCEQGVRLRRQKDGKEKLRLCVKCGNPVQKRKK